jgi:hypothetical protein
MSSIGWLEKASSGDVNNERHDRLTGPGRGNLGCAVVGISRCWDAMCSRRAVNQESTGNYVELPDLEIPALRRTVSAGRRVTNTPLPTVVNSDEQVRSFQRGVGKSPIITSRYANTRDFT